MPRMGDLAALDAYGLPDVGEPMIPSGISTEGVPWANRLVDYLTSGLPQQTDETVRYRTASPLVNITEGDIGRATEAAMGASAGGLSTKGIKAYHSSPHDFDKFDLAKIGSGEGAQVYGHGLYFAENPAVSGQGGQYWNQFLNRFPEEERRLAEMLKYNQFDRGKTGAVIQKEIDDYAGRIAPGGVFDKPHMTQAQERTRKYIEELSAERDKFMSGKPVGPRTYEVDIKADPAHMLDWDKPLSAQSDTVRGAAMDIRQAAARADYESRGFSPKLIDEYLRNAERGNLTGSQVYRVLPDKVRASAALREAGIPGIKYLDQGSRLPRSITDLETRIAKANEQLATWSRLSNDRTQPMMVQSLTDEIADLSNQLATAKATPQTSNYVIFDPSIIDITKKYAVPGALGAGGMGALAAQDRYEP